MTYKQIVKPHGYDKNIHNLHLYFPYNIIAYRNDVEYDFTIEVRDVNARPDCKIGDFGHNIWFRPAAACRKDFTGYKSYSSITRAIKNCLIKRGFTILGFYERWVK